MAGSLDNKIFTMIWYLLLVSYLDVDECSLASGNPCKNNGKCVNLLGSYKCTCNSGFTGKHCEIGRLGSCWCSSKKQGGVLLF